MKIKRNAIQCLKCGEVLESRHRHDFRECKCGNFVDGGRDYIRRGGNPDDMLELTEMEAEDDRKHG